MSKKETSTNQGPTYFQIGIIVDKTNATKHVQDDMQVFSPDYYESKKKLEALEKKEVKKS
ncbi:hypothetical protein A3A09_03715 [Candidatus Nomurabacteria bacterium RIFCSPLOWO2_01_FULL_42_20]|uniref:Uncharacterized protein n=1 Tax=Candidatus Nomurabacteria bacterium RIFCSPHIGHO2_01_FULL_42_16 TaxID=1801743 RepID=A0A1F6VI28_9BACT|nr:MAG: hypothetical protein A2824_00880 [Candidatus Nomurabacteria bacterium RIFCSPHIGHO2_01_FULL_42_16]OGI91414.1 MAG: hypothetical protein A3A09_03715 [Candidatus Nomurabacteria bacterium RIFCSPLOWO2_01_FULL_42_20]